ncbi:hypothetical protein LUU34_00294900 [Aix galericulata]|nr:hypothetical protein LUU34_00294900 [Aix galericulata]
MASLEKREIQDCLAYVASKDSQAYLDSKDSEVTLASQDCKACQAPQVHQGWAHRDYQGLLDSQDPRDHQDFLE